jgi:cytochrome c oxidase assembly protein subunit 15
MRIWEAPKSDGSLAPVASASDASRWNRLTPQGYRRVTLVAVWLIGLIVVTGGAVRLTHSGLGCTDWPTCQANRIYPEWQFHGWVEFGNRLVTGLVSIAVIVAVLGALVRVPRRRDLTWLSVGLVGGVVGQIVLGGIVVLFLRACRPDGSVQRPIAAPQVRTLGRVLIVVAALAIVTGTVVTGTGPHSGSNGDTLVKRLPFAITTVARVHGTVDLAALLVITALVVQLRRTRAPRAVQGRAEVVLVFGILQAAIGYTQYLTGVPEVLVALHILGATLVWTAVLWFFLGLFESVPARADLADGDERDAQGATALLGDARHDEPDGDRTGRDLVTGR